MNCAWTKETGARGVLLLALALAAAWTAGAKTLRVPEDFPTIQAAIDASAAGDIVQIAPGTYPEALQFKSGIELRGAGADSTIVSASILKGRVLTIEGADSGSISGCAFQHADCEKRSKDQNEWPAAVIIKNSNVSLRQCRLGPSLGPGAFIAEKSRIELTECVVEESLRSGLSIEGAETTATLRNNTCRKNNWHGIAFFKGAKGHLENNTCSANKQSGLSVNGMGTEATVLNNDLSGNTLTGLLAEDRAKVTARDNRCTGNGWYGIHLVLGATGVLEHNTCEENSLHGISVEDISTRAELSGNRCDKNMNNGIEFRHGSGGTARTNYCNGNGGTGIAACDWYTEAELEGNELVGNQYFGMYFKDGCRVSARKNIIRENRKLGVLIGGQGTDVQLEDNTLSGNAEGDSSKQDGMPEFAQYNMPERTVGWMISAERFDKLETLADRLRQAQYRTQEGRGPLRSFYDGVVQGYGEVKHHDREAYLAAMDRWLAAYPQSATPKIVLGLAYTDYAWDKRGNGWASEVSPEAWDGFHADLTTALKYFREAAALDPHDPQLYAGMIAAGMGASESTDVIKGYFEKGIAIDSTYPPLFSAMTNCLLPRWQGKKGDLEQFAVRAAEIPTNRLKDGMYAYVALCALSSYSEADFLSTHHFEWIRVKQGMEKLLEFYPQSKLYLNQFCRLACVYGDRETARGLFDRIGDNLDFEATWRDEQTPRQWRRWASGLVDPPLSPDDLEVWKNGGTRPAQLPKLLQMLLAGVGMLIVAGGLVAGISMLLLRRSASARTTPPPLPK